MFPIFGVNLPRFFGDGQGGMGICHFGGAMNAGVGWNGRSGIPTYDGIPTHLGVDPGIPMPGLADDYPGLQMIAGAADDSGDWPDKQNNNNYTNST